MQYYKCVLYYAGVDYVYPKVSMRFFRLYPKQSVRISIHFAFSQNS